MLVGREHEVALLGELIGRRQPVAVLGEAGVGKTTLVRAASEQCGARLVEAGGLATLSWLPYFPLRRAFGHDFEGDPAYVASLVEEELGPSVLFMDDLQWADEQTASLLPLLAGRVGLVAAIRRGDEGTRPALERSGEVGLELLPLEPLDAVAAAELARCLNPSLSDAAAKRLVDRSGGNPFLLEQLAASGEPSGSLRLAVAARVRALTPAGRSAIASLALLGRPAERSLLGEGATEIVEAGFASANGHVAIRHALLAEQAIAMLSDEERREVHSRLAGRLGDPGEAARHHAAAGEREAAYELALEAARRASTPGERAEHFALAAGCVDGDERASLRVRAAAALVEIGRFDTAEALLEDACPTDPADRARCALIRSQAREASGDITAATCALNGGDPFAAGTDLEVLLRVQRVHLELELEHDIAGTLDRALHALALARKRRAYEAEALYAAGLARYENGREGWESDLRTAIAAARKAGDLGLECRVAQDLGRWLFNWARADAGRRVLLTTSRRAAKQDATSWARRLRTRITWFDLHAGRFRQSAEECETLLEEAIEPWQRFFLAYIATQASNDLGRHGRAQELFAVLESRVAGDEQERQRLMALADLEFWAGRPRQAIAVAEEGIARFPHITSTFLELTRAGAYVDLGLDPGEPSIEPRISFLDGALPELRGYARLAAGANGEAAGCFAEAAHKWAGRHKRGELRSLWAEGEALRRADRADEAVKRLLLAERRCMEHAHAPLLGRIHRSLRLAGVDRKAPRSVEHGGLTGREAQVLELVATGLTNDEIARRLGVGRPTIVRLISSAQRKLGASSRTQAAALAAHE